MDKNEFEIIKIAMLNEIEGEKYFKTAADQAQNKETANVFLQLADDEKRHQAMLKGMLDHISKGQEISIDTLSAQATPSPVIFEAVNSNTVDSMEVSVFHLGILIEKASVDFYRESAQSTSLPAARNLYEKLADWEMNHLGEMEKIYNSLSDEWWDRQSYSPS